MDGWILVFRHIVAEDGKGVMVNILARISLMLENLGTHCTKVDVVQVMTT